MDWVWTRSTSKGNARTVLLAIADKCPDERCVAYAGTAMLMQRANASRSSVRAVVDALLASGELKIVEGAKGPRGETVYHLPYAVGHTLSRSDESWLDGVRIRPGSDSGPGQDPAPGGSESGPAGGQDVVPGGTESDPQNASNARERKEQQQSHAPARAASAVVEQLQPLVDALAAAGVAVRWSLGLGEQRDAHRLVERHGVAALVDLAAHRTAPGDAPKSARYWLKVWSDLDRPAPPSPAPAGNVVPFRGRSAPAAASNRQNLLAALGNIESRENA